MMAASLRFMDFLASARALLDAEPVLVSAPVAACRCAGRCRCAGMVPALLLRQIEQECEFYRRVM